MLFSLKNLRLAALSSFLCLSGSAFSEPECLPPCCPEYNLTVSLDTLYWKSCGWGLMYGTATTFDALVANTTIEHQYNTIKKLHYRPDIGYRLGLEYRDPCECWNAAISWTHFVNDAHGHYAKPATLSQWFTPAFGGATPTDLLLGGPFPEGIGAAGFPVHAASAHWKLRLNMIDVLVGKEYCMTSCLTLKPHVGVRAGLIDQRYDVKYVANTVELGTRFPFVAGQPTDHITMKSDYEGVGPRIGLDATYDLGCGISLYGNSAASLLWGMQDMQTKEDYVLTRQLPTPTTTAFNLKQKEYETGCRAITDVAIGIKWQYCCCQRLLAMQLGYEQHTFFNENAFEKFTNFDATGNMATDRYPQVSRGNLCIHGLVFSTRLDF